MSEFLVGRTAEGERVYVHMKFKNIEQGVRFSAMGCIVEKGETDAHSFGQCLDILPEVVEPTKGLTRADILMIHEIWEQYHLNDMNAGCEHMAKGAGWGLGDVCPLCGYSWGSAWKYRPIPDYIMKEIARLQGILGGLPRYKGN